MARRRRPEIRIEQRMHNRAVAAGTFAENTAMSCSAATELLLHEGHGFLQQKIGPAADTGAVDILIAAELGEAVRKCNHSRRHGARRDEPVRLLRDILREIAPIRVRRSACGKANEIDKQGQAVSVVSGGNIDIDDTRGGVAERIILQHRASNGQALYRACSRLRIASHVTTSCRRCRNFLSDAALLGKRYLMPRLAERAPRSSNEDGAR